LLWHVLLGTAGAERNKRIGAANAHCFLDCGGQGYCEFQKYTDYPQQGDVGWFPFCACLPGFGGGSCEEKIAECQPPEYKCNNGAPCVMTEEGETVCDCSHAEAKSDFAGEMCRSPSISKCETLDEQNDSFCTNGGVCLSTMTASTAHLMFSGPVVHQGCQCDSAFVGAHCQYLRDMPASSLLKGVTQGRSAGSKAGISLTMLSIFGIAGLVYKRKRHEINDQLGEMWRRAKASEQFAMSDAARSRICDNETDAQSTERVDLHADEDSGRLIQSEREESQVI